MAKNTPLENHFLVVAYQSLGKNIKKDTWEGPKSIELVEKTAHRLGTFFGLPNHFHLIQCAKITNVNLVEDYFLKILAILRNNKYFSTI